MSWPHTRDGVSDSLLGSALPLRITSHRITQFNMLFNSIPSQINLTAQPRQVGTLNPPAPVSAEVTDTLDKKEASEQKYQSFSKGFLVHKIHGQHADRWPTPGTPVLSR